MKKRESRLADGRYLIFFTFEDEATAESETAAPPLRSEPPPPQVEAEEERGV